MFCPSCGAGDQSAESYCRNCGAYLPDFEKAREKRATPRDHFTANTVLSVMTAVVSLTLAIMLYARFLGREDTPVLIYVTAGFLTAMFFWQAQVIWRSVLLRKEFPKRDVPKPALSGGNESVPVPKLSEADPDLFVGRSTGTKVTTKIPRRSPQSEHQPD